MSESSIVWRFNGRELEPLETRHTVELLVADSWLTVDGRTAKLGRHFTRFSRGCEEQGLVNSSHRFLEAVEDLLPETGDWFPRIELTIRGELIVRMRPAPQRTLSVIAWTSPHDPRMTPSIKGPDILALEELRSVARESGADEPIILGDDGFVTDGTTTALIWWRGSTLCIPPRSRARVASVTLSIMEDIAAAQAIEIVEELSTPADLASQEVWALNALHGIRSVSEWSHQEAGNPDQERLAKWRAAYAQTRKP